MAVVISLKLVYTPVDDTVTAPLYSTSTSTKLVRGVAKKWLSMKKTAQHGAPSRDIRSPWRQLLSLPIPCHVHWQRSCCQSLSRPPAICGKPCFQGRPRIQRAGCHTSKGRNTIPRVRRGCAAGAWTPAWVRGGGTWRRGRAACVGRVPGCIDADVCRPWLVLVTGSNVKDIDTDRLEP